MKKGDGRRQTGSYVFRGAVSPASEVKGAGDRTVNWTRHLFREMYAEAAKVGPTREELAAAARFLRHSDLSASERYALPFPRLRD